MRRLGLPTEVSVGNNVRQPRPLVNENRGYELPSPKRRKIKPQISQFEGMSAGSDGVDPLHMGAAEDVVVSLSRESQKKSQTISGRSQVKDLSQPTIDGGVAEYHSVEIIMNSNPSKAQRRKLQSRTSQTRSSSSRSESATLLDACPSTASNPIQLSDDDTRDAPDREHSAKSRSPGMSRQSAVMMRGVRRQVLQEQVRDTGEQSSHFPRPTSPVRANIINYPIGDTEEF